MTKEQAAEQLYPYEKTARKSLKQFDWEEGFEAGAEWQEQQFTQLIDAAREALNAMLHGDKNEPTTEKAWNTTIDNLETALKNMDK